MSKASLPIAGAVPFLNALPPERWAIVTSAPRPLALLRMQAAGIPVPALMVAGEDVSHGKPAPDCFLLAAKRLGVDIGDCLVFEDAPAGIAAGGGGGRLGDGDQRHPLSIQMETPHATNCRLRRRLDRRRLTPGLDWLEVPKRSGRLGLRRRLKVAGQALHLPVAIATGFLAATAADFLRRAASFSQYISRRASASASARLAAGVSAFGGIVMARVGIGFTGFVVHAIFPAD